MYAVGDKEPLSTNKCISGQSYAGIWNTRKPRSRKPDRASSNQVALRAVSCIAARARCTAWFHASRLLYHWRCMHHTSRSWLIKPLTKLSRTVRYTELLITMRRVLLVTKYLTLPCLLYLSTHLDHQQAPLERTFQIFSPLKRRYVLSSNEMKRMAITKVSQVIFSRC